MFYTHATRPPPSQQPSRAGEPIAGGGSRRVRGPQGRSLRGRRPAVRTVARAGVVHGDAYGRRISGAWCAPRVRRASFIRRKNAVRMISAVVSFGPMSNVYIFLNFFFSITSSINGHAIRSSSERSRLDRATVCCDSQRSYQPVFRLVQPTCATFRSGVSCTAAARVRRSYFVRTRNGLAFLSSKSPCTGARDGDDADRPSAIDHCAYINM